MTQQPRFIGLLGVGILTLLATVLAGCDGASTGSGGRLDASPTATPFATTTPRPTLTPRPFGQKCSSLLGEGNPVIATAGDLQFTAINTVSIDPERHLPDNLPTKPYALSGQSGYLDSFTVVNVHLYSFMLCNASTTKSHSVGSITVKLDSFATDTNTINTSHYCVDLYTPQQGVVQHSGCGGGFAGGDVNLKASFAASGGVGAVVSATDADTGQALAPFTLAPGYAIYGMLDVTPPTPTGTTKYRIGIALDGAAPIYAAPASPPVLNAATTHPWDGNSCASGAMQSQMPAATNPPTFYICPKA
jgi:hypothetical protein